MLARWTSDRRFAHDSDLPALEVLGFSMGVEYSREGAIGTSLSNIDRIAQEQVRKAKDALAHSPVARDPKMAKFLRSTIRQLRDRPWPLHGRSSSATMTKIAKYRLGKHAEARQLVARHFTPEVTSVQCAGGVMVNAQIVAAANLKI